MKYCMHTPLQLQDYIFQKIINRCLYLHSVTFSIAKFFYTFKFLWVLCVCYGLITAVSFHALNIQKYVKCKYICLKNALIQLQVIASICLKVHQELLHTIAQNLWMDVQCPYLPAWICLNVSIYYTDTDIKKINDDLWLQRTMKNYVLLKLFSKWLTLVPP